MTPILHRETQTHTPTAVAISLAHPSIYTTPSLSQSIWSVWRREVRDCAPPPAPAAAPAAVAAAVAAPG